MFWCTLQCRFSGVPPYSSCADKLDFKSAECAELQICVDWGTSWLPITQSLFPEGAIVSVKSFEDGVTFLNAGVCNAIAGEASCLFESSIRAKGFTGPEYEIGGNVYSHEPLAVVTRQDDRVWSIFVSWILNALVQAEELGITKVTASSMTSTNSFGEQFRDMFQNAVGATGNIGEIYERNLGNVWPRGNGLNTINTGNSGLIYSFPFGNIETQGPEPSVDGKIEAIRNRGVLNCGLIHSPGLSTNNATSGLRSGMDVDICRGIAAALFDGNVEVHLKELGERERFPELAAGLVDIVIGGLSHTLSREVREDSTGQGFDFSPPYLFDGLGFSGPLPYGLCADELTFDSTKLSADCVDTKICVIDGTTWLDAMLGPLNIPDNNFVVTVNEMDSQEKFISGECNVIAGESHGISKSTLRHAGYPVDFDVEYHVGKNKHTREVIAIASRSDDIQFSDFVRWIVFGFFQAEEKGITKVDASLMPETKYFGNSLSRMWKDSVGTVGNYGEIFERNLASLFERSGRNNLNIMKGPQMFGMPI